MSSKITAIKFDRSSAGSYDNHAQVQRIMADRLVNLLKEKEKEGYKVGPNILEIGCGTGALTQLIIKDWPSTSITALDIAPAMIKVAEQRILSVLGTEDANSIISTNSSTSTNNTNSSQKGRFRFIHADVEKWAAEASASTFDIIVSNACFQWLSHPEQTLAHLRRMLRTGGMLIFTTFGPKTFYELHQAFNEVYQAYGVEPQRHGLSFQPVAEWEHFLKKAGFSMTEYEHWVQQEKYASARDFLLSVKAMGASTSEAVPTKGLSSRQLFANMYKEYEAKFSLEEGGVNATYDLLLFHACASN